MDVVRSSTKVKPMKRSRSLRALQLQRRKLQKKQLLTYYLKEVVMVETTTFISTVYSYFFLQIFFSKNAFVLSSVAFFTLIISIALSTKVVQGFAQSANLTYLFWIIPTRIGDVFLVSYLWKLNTNGDAHRQLGKCTVFTVILTVIATHFFYLLAPGMKTDWQTPEKTSFYFKLSASFAIFWYFLAVFISPFWKAAAKKDPIVDLNADKECILAWPLAIISISVSMLSMIFPNLFGFGLFKIIPVLLIPISISVSIDQDKDITNSPSYCLLFSIFQLGIHSLPIFVEQIIFAPNISPKILTFLSYYVLMAAYGVLWRQIARLATSSELHIPLLTLFQVFDSVFSNVIYFRRTHRISFLQFAALRVGRILIRESRIIHDVFNYFVTEKKTITQVGIRQSARLRSARQNILFDVYGFLFMPALIHLNTVITNNNFGSTTTQQSSEIFTASKCVVIVLINLIAGTIAWVYLCYRSSIIYDKIFPVKTTNRKLSISGGSNSKLNGSESKMICLKELIVLNIFSRKAVLDQYCEDHLPFMKMSIIYGVFNAIMFTAQMNAKYYQNET